MFIVIQVRDNRVIALEYYKKETDALDYAVGVCQENGAVETEEEIRKELKEDHEYIPSKWPEWSVAISEHKKNQVN